MQAEHGTFLVSGGSGFSVDTCTKPGVVFTTLRISLLAELFPFYYYDSGIKAPGYAPASCHIAGIFWPLSGSRHYTQKKA